jgi:hypothetical protein
MDRRLGSSAVQGDQQTGEGADEAFMILDFRF